MHDQPDTAVSKLQQHCDHLSAQALHLVVDQPMHVTEIVLCSYRLDMKAISDASDVIHRTWCFGLQVQKMLCICW